ncbi:MAG: HIT family protein [Porticoccaceae bacterium]
MVESVATEALSPTMRKFGAPNSTLRHYSHWSVLLRPQQITLGSLVLIAREAATAWPMLSAAAFAELKSVTADLEQALKQAFNNDKINYLMLMMVDPDVHFHVIPRYGTARTFAGHEFTDAGWPGPPRLDFPNKTSDIINTALSDELIRCWPK